MTLADRLPPWPALLLLAALAAAFPAARAWHRRQQPTARAHIAYWRGRWWQLLPGRTLGEAADHARHIAKDDTEGGP